MMRKLNVVRIVADHVKTLRNHGTKRIRGWDILTFFGVPLLVSLGLMWAGIRIGTGAVQVLATAFSVLAALLFNLLLIIYQISGGHGSADEGDRATENGSDARTDLLKDSFKNISFTILVAVAILALLLGSVLDLPEVENGVEAWTASLYYLITLFLLTLMMILKRIHVLLLGEVEQGY